VQDFPIRGPQQSDVGSNGAGNWRSRQPGRKVTPSSAAVLPARRNARARSGSAPA
jgi:hypothetical protein